MSKTPPAATLSPFGQAWREAITSAGETLETLASDLQPRLRARERGMVTEIQRGIANVVGLPSAWSDEVLRFAGNQRGFAFNLDPEAIGCVMLDEAVEVTAGSRVERTGRVLDTAVGDALLGRVVDPLGRPLDGGPPLRHLRRVPCENDAPPIMHRAPVTIPLQTGLKVIDTLIPIGRGQRQLVLGDRQTGKTSVALDTIINQRDQGVVCIYCSIGQRSTAVARVVARLREHDAFDHSIVVLGADDAPPGIQFIAPYAATAIGEHFMREGRDVLVVYDDLSTHARAYRHVSLLLRRPPGREAFPGDIFYVHSRLLERSTRLRDARGGGSLTALPIVETEAQNVAAYIPTNLISITDGQIYLSPKLFHKGILPAVDVGRSVSRVGGKTQLPAYRSVAGQLRLHYTQFEEVEKFARFSSQLDEDTRQTLHRGRRIRQILQQEQYRPQSVPEQIASLIAVTGGLFDDLSVDQLPEAERNIQAEMLASCPDISKRIASGEKLSEQDVDRVKDRLAGALATLAESEPTSPANS
jgi:F-type H+-transporting ATPase subunit alpha